jgi:hypothetical protein
MIFKHFHNFSYIYLLHFSIHVIEVNFTLVTVQLVAIFTEQILPYFVIFLHKLSQQFLVYIFLLFEIYKFDNFFIKLIAIVNFVNLKLIIFANKSF